MKTSRLNNYSNLTQRIIAGLFGAAMIIFGSLWSDWAFFAIFLSICALTQLEFYKLAGLDGLLPLKYWGTISGVVLFTLTFMVQKGLCSEDWYYILFPIVSIGFFIKLYKKEEEKPFTNIAFTFLGIIYVAVPFALFNVLAFSQGLFSYELVIGCLFLHWANDVGAYFTGVNFGKTKLFERVSPKKSWEGSIGGLILTILLAFGISNIFHDLFMWQWFAIAGIIVVAGTYGDLVESLFKRSMQIKDSGSTIPGHGGFLDRFDGLLLSVPFIVAFLMIFV